MYESILNQLTLAIKCWKSMFHDKLSIKMVWFRAFHSKTEIFQFIRSNRYFAMFTHKINFIENKQIQKLQVDIWKRICAAFYKKIMYKGEKFIFLFHSFSLWLIIRNAIYANQIHRVLHYEIATVVLSICHVHTSADRCIYLFISSLCWQIYTTTSKLSSKQTEKNIPLLKTKARPNVSKKSRNVQKKTSKIEPKQNDLMILIITIKEH